MKHNTDVLILGGGVIGCAIAYYLSKQGVSVTVLERGEIGSQASSAAAGIFSLLKPLTKMDDYTRLLLASRALFPSLVADLQALSGIDPEYEQTATLRTSRSSNPKMTTRLQRWAATCRAEGLQVQLLTEQEVHQLEPMLSSEIVAATRIMDEGQVRATRLVEAFAKAAIYYGATIRTYNEVGSIQHSSNRVIGVITTQGERIACNHLVIASGAWSASCGEWLNVVLPVSPQRGQLLALQQLSTPIRHILIGYGIYLAPKRDNTMIVGATQEEVGFDTRVTVGGVLELLQAAIQLVPALESVAIERVWAGLRPKTPDNYPILGKVARWENVILAVGHSSFGVLLSAITGQTIAEIVTTGRIPEIIRPFALERFAHLT